MRPEDEPNGFRERDHLETFASDDARPEILPGGKPQCARCNQTEREVAELQRLAREDFDTAWRYISQLGHFPLGRVEDELHWRPNYRTASRRAAMLREHHPWTCGVAVQDAVDGYWRELTVNSPPELWTELELQTGVRVTEGNQDMNEQLGVRADPGRGRPSARVRDRAEEREERAPASRTGATRSIAG